MLRKYCEVSSCCGIIDLYEARGNKFRFTFWIVVMTTMLVASCWFTNRTIVGYIQSPTVTNVQTVPQIPLPLPDMIACYTVYGGMAPSPAEIHAAKNEFEEYMNNSNVDVRYMIDKFGYDCGDIVHSTPSSNGIFISCSNATPVSDPYVNGKCYLFENLKPQPYPQRSGGINFQLKQPNSSFYQMYEKFTSKYSIANGFTVSLEKNFGNRPSGRQLRIPMNVVVDIVLFPKHYLRLPDSNVCDDSDELYNSNTCFTRCNMQQMKADCNCVRKGYEDFEDPADTVCDPFTYGDYCSKKINNTIVRACEMSCLPKCDEWIYESMVTYHNLDVDRSNESTIIIYYNAMQYIEIATVEAFTMDMAIANVGGQSGLWLGASVVTFIQALYYLCLSFIKTKLKKVKKSNAWVEHQGR